MTNGRRSLAIYGRAWPSRFCAPGRRRSRHRRRSCRAPRGRARYRAAGDDLRRARCVWTTTSVPLSSTSRTRSASNGGTRGGRAARSTRRRRAARRRAPSCARSRDSVACVTAWPRAASSSRSSSCVATWRSRSAPESRGAAIAGRRAHARHQRADAAIGEQLGDHAVRRAPVDDVHAADAACERRR